MTVDTTPKDVYGVFIDSEERRRNGRCIPLSRMDDVEVHIMQDTYTGKWHPAKFVALSLLGSPIVQQQGGMPIYATWGGVRLKEGTVLRAPEPTDHLLWALERWIAEVKNRTDANIHKKTLDSTWRQVIIHHGGDPAFLIDL